MRISELSSKNYLGNSGVGENSYLIINYDNDGDSSESEEVEVNQPVTYKVKMDELGKGLINDLNIVQYGENRLLKTLSGGEEDYSDSTVGYFMDANDKNAIDSAVTAVTYDTTNKKFTRAIRNGTAADVVTTAQILIDMNLNVSDTADSTKYVSSVSESGGKITVARESFSPSLTLTAGTTANAPKIKTTVAGNVSADIELTKASVGTNGVYGVTRLSSAINSSDETVAATPKAVKDAIDSIPITSTSTLGLIKMPSQDRGLELVGDNSDTITIRPATETQIKSATNYYCPVGPARQHISVFYGLAKAAGDSTQATSDNAVGTYTTDAQNAIRTMIGAGTYSKPSGGIPATDLAETYLTQHQSLSGLAPTESPEFTTQITIGNTTLTEAQLQALIAMLPENEEPQGG